MSRDKKTAKWDNVPLNGVSRGSRRLILRILLSLPISGAGLRSLGRSSPRVASAIVEKNRWILAEDD
jgi:hypothetical protein